jgi:hypothetical protein
MTPQMVSYAMGAFFAGSAFAFETGFCFGDDFGLRALLAFIGGLICSLLIQFLAPAILGHLRSF